MSHQHMMLGRGQRLYQAAPLCMARCDTLDYTKFWAKRSPRQPGMAKPHN